MPSGPYDRAVSAIYEAALHPDGIESALPSIGEAVGAFGIAQWKVWKPAGTIAYLHSHGHERAAQEDYLSYFHTIDPAAAKGLSSAPGTWVMDAGAVDPRIPSHQEYFHDFCVPHGIGRIAGVKILETADTMIAFSLQRPLGAKAFEADQAIMDRLLPHLMRSARLAESLQSLMRGKALLEETLNQVAAAVCIVSLDGTVLYLNSQASDSLSKRSGLEIRHGRMQGTCLQVDAQLQRALSNLRREPRVATGFRVGAGGEQVVVAPLPEMCSAPGAGIVPRALIFIGQGSCPHNEDILRGLFGFTAAEARLARAIAAGKSLEEIQLKGGPAISTLRTHLASIFHKSGVASQAQLVAVIRALPSLHSQPGRG